MGHKVGRESIDDLVFDDYNQEEMARHGVTIREVRQVFDRGFRLLRNAKEHTATHLMVGRTNGGRWLTIPIARTAQPGVWRPATAFPSRPADRAKLKGDIA
jgi:uncharacterized DUF497 family protein